MTTIIEGMTPAQFITALNNNATELVINWDVNQTAVAKSFLTLIASTATPININYNLRNLAVFYGQRGVSYINALNSGFASTIQRFQDNFLPDIMSPMAAYGEPTVLVSDDGEQMDIWFTGLDGGVYNVYYSYSTDGLTFAEPVKTNIPNGYARSGAMKEGNTYYLFANGAGDTTIHLFTSTNKTTFADQGEKIGLGAAGTWDVSGLGNTFVWKEGSTYYLFYDGQRKTTAGGDNWWKTGYATSPAITGPWTKYASNPVFDGVDRDVEGAEMFRVNNEIIKRSDGRYAIYINSGTVGVQGPFYDIKRKHSANLNTWTDEGNILNVLQIEAGYISYADVAFVQFKGKSYMFNNPSNQVDAAYLDIAIDNRTLAELLALYP